MEFSRHGGTMRGTNPTTGETFAGEYTATREKAIATAAGVTASASSLTATGLGVLIGDKGTVLDCEININSGYVPTGVGTCTDQQGRRYRLQF